VVQFPPIRFSPGAGSFAGEGWSLCLTIVVKFCLEVCTAPVQAKNLIRIGWTDYGCLNGNEMLATPQGPIDPRLVPYHESADKGSFQLERKDVRKVQALLPCTSVIPVIENALTCCAFRVLST